MAFGTIEKRREYQNKYYHDNHAMLLRRQANWRKDNKERYTAYHRKYKRELRREVLTHYGNDICACVICGETNIFCLSIDHIDGGGYAHRKSKGMIMWGGNIYGYLRKEGYPQGYQTLCMNCQWIKWAIQRGDVDWDLMADIKE